MIVSSHPQCPMLSFRFSFLSKILWNQFCISPQSDSPPCFSCHLPPVAWPPGHLATYHLEPELQKLEPPYGNFRSQKWFLHIGPDVSCWDPTLIHAVQPIWSHQGGLWPDIPHLWHFEAVFGHKNSPKDKKKVGSSWISIYLNHRDHLKPLVHFINTLFLDPPPLSTLWTMNIKKAFHTSLFSLKLEGAHLTL